MLLENRIALVTGAGAGIGQAIALAYARAGATVLLLGRTQTKLETVQDAIHAENLGQAVLIPLDLEKELHRIPAVVEAICNRFGHLDILVNAAARLGVLTPLAAYKPTVWESVLRVNVTAPFFLIRELMPLLQRSSEASVINLIPAVGQQGKAYWGAYGISKAALWNLTQTWSQELAALGVRMNGVDPGAVATALRAKAFPGEDPAQLPTPEQIVPVFLYLASSFSKEVNGQLLQAQDWRSWQP